MADGAYSCSMSRVTHLPYGASEGMRRLKEQL